MAGIELATAYITLAVETSGITRQVWKAFDGADKVAAATGRSMGAGMSKAFEQTKPDVERLAASYERSQQRMETASRRAAQQEENLARKVEIANQEKQNAVEKYGEGSIQAMKATDKLALAEQKLEAASIRAEAEQDKLRKQTEGLSRELEDAQISARDLGKGFDNTADQASDFGKAYDDIAKKIVKAGEKSAKTEEDLARKVEIAARAKAQAVSKYGEDSLEALRATDKLASAEERLETAAQEATREHDKLSIELGDVERAARDMGVEFSRADDSFDPDNVTRGFREVRSGADITGRAMESEFGAANKDIRHDSSLTSDHVVEEFREAGRKGGDGLSKGLGDGLTSWKSSFLGNFLSDLVRDIFSTVVNVSKEAIEMASEGEQAAGGVDAVFKEFAGQINQAAATAAMDLGLSEIKYQELVVPIGSMLKNQGIDDFADQTQGLIELGADLAAMYGGSTDSAVGAISALLRGEQDPIERYGVNIKKSAINNRMAEKGWDNLTGAALEQAEAMVRLELLYEQTADAQGQFGREAETNQGKAVRATAKLEDAQRRFGDFLMPFQTEVYTFLADDLVPLLENYVIPAVGGVIDLFKGEFNADLWGKLGIIEDDLRVQTLMDTRNTIEGIFDLFVKDTFNEDVWGKLGVKEDDPRIQTLIQLKENLEAVGTAIKDGWERNVKPSLGRLGEAVEGLRNDAVGPILEDFGGLFMDKWSEWTPALEENIGQISGIISGRLDTISETIETVTDTITLLWDLFGDDILYMTGIVFDDLARKFGAGLDVLEGLLLAVTGIMSGDWGKFSEGMGLITSGMWEAIKSQFKLTADWLGINVEGIKDTVTTKWNALKDNVVEASEKLAAGVGVAWDKVKALAAKPINFVIREVYNNGVKKLIDGVIGVFGGDPLPEMREIRVTEAATGGVLPGFTPGRDVHTFISPTGGILRLSGGEAIMRPEWTREVGGPAAVERMNRAAMGFASGGVWPAPGTVTSPYGFRVGPFNGPELHDGIDIANALGTPIVSALAGIVTQAGWNGGYGNYVAIDHGGFNTFYAHLQGFNVAVGDFVKAGQLIASMGSTGWSTGPHLHFGTSLGDPMQILSGNIPEGAGGGIFADLVNFPGKIADFIGQLRDMGDTSWAKAISGATRHSLSKVVDWFKEKLTSWLPTFGGVTGGDFNQWWNEAIAIAGPSWSKYRNAVATVARHESGMNPNAVNNWDSNAMAGTPSKGLLQFIEPTFRAYAWPGRNNWLNPVDQILAFFRYVPARYGSIQNHPGLRSMLTGGSYRGYWQGTDSALPGPAWVGERGPELVVSKQLRRMRGGEQVIPVNQFAGTHTCTIPDRMTLVAEDGSFMGLFRTVAGDVVRESFASSSPGAVTSRFGVGR